MSDLGKFAGFVGALLPALEGLYHATRGDTKKAIKLLKSSYQAMSAKQLEQWAAKGGRRPDGETTDIVDMSKRK